MLRQEDVLRVAKGLNNELKRVSDGRRKEFLNKLIEFAPIAAYELRERGIPSIVLCREDIWPTVNKYFGEFTNVVPNKDVNTDGTMLSFVWVNHSIVHTGELLNQLFKQ